MAVSSDHRSDPLQCQVTCHCYSQTSALPTGQARPACLCFCSLCPCVCVSVSLPSQGALRVAG